MKPTHFLTRTLALCLAALLSCGGLAACSGGGETPTDTETSSSAPTASDTQPATEGETAPETDTTPETETDAPVETELKLAGNGLSCNIMYDTGNTAARYAAYTLQESLAPFATAVGGSEADGMKANIRLCGATDIEALGDCGYSMTASDAVLYIYAPSLAGFDNAMKQLLADGSTADGLAVPLDYTASRAVSSGANYSFDAEDFNTDYVSAPFYNDKNDAAAYVCNAMWHMFGAVDDGQNLVYRFGNEPTYYAWMSEKIMWSGNTGYINDLKGKLQSFPQTENGYMWSWSSFPYWKVDTTYCIHYDGTFRYIAAVYDVISWENSTDFLQVTDTSRAGGEYSELDASYGRTVLEKVEAAWNYIYYSLKGEEGLIHLTEESVYLTADGSSRFDYVKATGEYCWNNTGLPKSAASNYWDNLCFGNLDAYESALFYEAAQAMIGIYGMLGGEYLDRIPALTALCETVHEKYDATFWSDTTGRYIACVDTEGNRVDYGLTFLNFEALKYGLGDASRAESVFSWIDGTRIVEGDDRTGADILSYYTILRRTEQGRDLKKFDQNAVLAAVTNTVAINNKENKVTGKVWWHAPAGIDPFGSAAYGSHCENGGYIFYPVYYELMARVKYQGAQAVTDRYAQIAHVYEFNRLKSDAAVSGSANWLEGLNGEFPESGLVPTAYFYGLMGITAEADGLHIAPIFNETYETMGVASTTYGGHTYGIEEDRNGSLTLNCPDGVAELSLTYTPGRFTTYTVTVFDGAGNHADSYAITADEAGKLHIELSLADVVRVEITPVLDS